MEVPLNEVVYFDAITSNPSTGAVSDADSTPTFAVYEEGTDTAIVTGNLTKRTSLTGDYRGTYTASAANGFEVGKWYSVVAAATVNSISGKAVVQNFRCVAAETVAGAQVVDVGYVGGSTASTATSVDANVVSINSVSASGVTVVSANVGTTQPLNFTGTGSTAYVKAGLWEILGTVLTETAGQIAGGFKKFFNIASPTSTMNQITLVDTTTTLTNAPSDSSGTTTLLSRLSSTRATNLDNLDAAVSTRLATSGYTSPLASAVQQAVAGLIRGYTTFLFVNKSGNDSTGDGLTPATAYLTVFKATSTAAAFTAIVVGPGVYDEGTHTLTVPTDGALIGAGRDNTTIQAQTVSTGLAGVIVKPSTRCKITDLTIQGNAASGVSQVPLGVESFDPGFTNARFERLRVIADADGIYVSGSVCSFVAEDVQIDTNYDCFAFFSPVTCTLRRVSARALGPSGVSSGVTARALNNQSASSVINAYDSSFLAQDATTTTTGIENAVGGTIRLFGNTSVRASSATGTVKDIVSGNNVTAAGSVVYDAVKITGTITAAGAAAQDYARLLNPTSTLNLSGTTVGTATALGTAYNPAKTAAQAGDAMTLTPGERTATATAIFSMSMSTFNTAGTAGNKLKQLTFTVANIVDSSATITGGGDASEASVQKVLRAVEGIEVPAI
jgi:hypothetical protein